jgi:hypothetical protein
MTADEVVAALTANIGKRVRLTFEDGVIQTVDIGNIDEEGVLHSGPDGAEPNGYWTRFEHIRSVAVEND